MTTIKPQSMQKIPALKITEQHQLIMPVLQTLAIWLVLIFTKFKFARYNNEVSKLPDARQFIEPNWLPNDWYLNVGTITYPDLFNLIFGPIVYWLGFEFGEMIWRLLIYLLLAVAIYLFFRAIQLRFLLGLLVLFFFLADQSLVAGEWIVGSPEPKVVAYAFVLISLAAFIRKQYFWGFLAGGAAFSFHILVGYAMFCTAGLLVLNPKIYWPDWRKIVTRSGAFFITGAFGIIVALQQQGLEGGEALTRAWEFYVVIRHPHHLYPTWTNNWAYLLALATCFFLLIYLFRRSSISRQVAAYALSSVSLFMIGLVIYALGEIPFLRFYWFRFPDVIIPFMSAVLVALLLNDLLNGNLTVPGLSQPRWREIRLGLSRALPPVLIAMTLLLTARSAVGLAARFQRYLNGGIGQGGWVYKENIKVKPMFEWIAANTPKEAVFLVDPWLPEFYIHAERARFVSYKHTPQDGHSIIEWLERLKLINGDLYPQVGFTGGMLHANYQTLDEKIIERIAERYEVSYYLVQTRPGLRFEPVHTVAGYTLYRIDARDQ